MKRFYLTTILSYILCVHCFAQRTSISESVSIVLPFGAEKLTNQQIKNFADSNGYMRVTIPADQKNVYKINGALLQLYDSKTGWNKNNIDLQPKAGVKKNSLDEQKETVDAIFNRYHNKTYQSYIRTYNNCKALISKQTRQKTIYYSFYSINTSDTRNLRGLIECKIADSASANVLLNELLERIKFTNP